MSNQPATTTTKKFPTPKQLKKRPAAAAAGAAAATTTAAAAATTIPTPTIVPTVQVEEPVQEPDSMPMQVDPIAEEGKAEEAEAGEAETGEAEAEAEAEEAEAEVEAEEGEAEEAEAEVEAEEAEAEVEAEEGEAEVEAEEGEVEAGEEAVEVVEEVSSVPQTFESCLLSLGTRMEDSYMADEEGEPIEIDDEQREQIALTIDAVKTRAEEAFLPLFQSLMAKLEQQATTISQLRAGVGSTSSLAAAAAAAAASSTPVPLDANAEIPTAAWIITNRKSKSQKALTGYNCFTMFYMAKNKASGGSSTFPPKGLWDQQNKVAWNTLAQQVNTGGVPAAAAAAASAPGASIQESKGGKKITAYNVFTKEYMKNNPGKGFPPKGTWAQISKEEAAHYQMLAEKLKAERA